MRRPLFLECDPAQAWTAWAGIALNAAFILWCAFWMTSHHAAGGSAACLLISIPATVLLADLFSGMVHWFSDTWLDETGWTRVISIAREHHIYPQNIIGYGFRDYIAYSS
jgi:hypothetical protein